MTIKNSKSDVSQPVDLSKELFSSGGDFQLLCCSSPEVVGKWVSAAEMVYEFTKEPGSVVRDTITFTLSRDEKIELSLLTGGFEIFKGAEVIARGRKGIDLLMQWKGMSYESALEYIAATYSKDHAETMGADYQRMKSGSVPG